MDFLTELSQLAERIRDNHRLELLSHDSRPGVSQQELRDVEAKLGARIPEDVSEFYRAMNGVTLKWRFRVDLPEDVKQKVVAEFSPLGAHAASLFDVAGSLQILPVTDMLLNEEYALPQNEDIEGTFDFDGRIYSDNEFCRMLRPFDVIDDFFCVAFVVVPDAFRWKLLLLSDYWIEYDSSHTIWLDDYLQFVTATWAIRMARAKGLSAYRGDRQPPLMFDPDVARSLVPPVLGAGSS